MRSCIKKRKHHSVHLVSSETLFFNKFPGAPRPRPRPNSTHVLKTQLNSNRVDFCRL